MSWRDLVQEKEESLSTAWVGGRELRKGGRTWEILGRLPREFGWYKFALNARKATAPIACDPDPTALQDFVSGYLVGDRLIQDGAEVNPDPKKVLDCSETVLLLDPGLDRFVRVSAGRTHEDGPLIFKEQLFPMGPEDAVLEAYLNKHDHVNDIKNVGPALDMAFRMETFQRAETERMRAEAEKRRIEEERKQEIMRQVGSAAGRRELAKLDFVAAAKAALRLTGAEYLDHRASRQRNEVIVQFRFQNRRFECVCHKETLAIIEAGICLTDHHTGERGDTLMTLESLPSVISEAIRTRVLHVFRHVDDQDIDDHDEDWDDG